MDFSKARKEQLGIASLAELQQKGKITSGVNKEKFVYGPKEFDCLHHMWTRGNILGILADSGAGKTMVSLNKMKAILQNNPDSSAVFVSLEMTTDNIATRWFSMTEDCPELAERLYIISRYDENGKAREISVGWIRSELEKYRAVIGDIVVITIDHFHLCGDNDVSSLNNLAIKIKEIAVSMNAFLILLAQVSKSVGKKGEVPLDADAVYGASSMKWICTDMIQIHRPIKRYEDDAKLSVLGYGYVKVREAHKDDKLRVGQNKLLKYDISDHSFSKMTNAEYTTFKLYYNSLLEVRSAEEKHSAHEYDITKEVPGKDGKVVVINEKFSGDVLDDL